MVDRPTITVEKVLKVSNDHHDRYLLSMLTGQCRTFGHHCPQWTITRGPINWQLVITQNIKLIISDLGTRSFFFRAIERWANLKIGHMSARAIAIHGYEMSWERSANLEIKSECPALTFVAFTIPPSLGLNGTWWWQLWKEALRLKVLLG